MVLAQHAATGGSYPVIILLLLLAWGAWCVGSVHWVMVHWREGQPGMLVAALASGLLAMAAGLLLAPGLPMICTYTGLSHITSAYHLSALEWQWPFPTDYPLTVPSLAAALTLVLGRTPETMGWANWLLTGLAASGAALFAGRLWRSTMAAWGAGLAVAGTPLLWLLAKGDTLSVGYLALSGWTALLTLDVVSGRGGRLLKLGLVGALVLTVQSRAEALCFVLVIGAMPFVLESTEWRAGMKRLWPVVGLALLALLPYGANLAGEFSGGDRNLSTELGFHYAWKTLVATGFVAFTVVVAGSVIRVRRAGLWLPGALLLVLIAGLTALYGTAVWTSKTACWGPECLAQSYLTVRFWLASPKVVPLVVPALALVGLYAFRNRSEANAVALLALWAGGIVAVASVKMTGELPYEGARTQIPALLPLAALVGLGVHRLVALPGGVCLRWAGALAALMVLTTAVPVRVINTHGYDEQAEFSFVRNCLENLPDRGVILAPDDVLDVMMLGDTESTQVDLFHLYRTAYLVEALGDAGRQIRVAPWRAFENLNSGDRPLFWFRSLNCYRSGDGSLTPSCAEALAMPEWQPVCEGSVDNRPYTADFFTQTRIVGQTVVLGIYAWPKEGKERHAVP